MTTPEQPNTPERIEQVQHLVNVAFSEGPEKAIDQARKTGDNGLVDDLQAALSAPDVHAKLIERQKVNPAA